MFKFSKNSIRAMRLIFIILFICVNLSSCYFYPKEEKIPEPPIVEPPQLTYETVNAALGNISKKISVTGKYVSVSQQSLSFKDKGGYLKVLNVKLGDYVKKGDVLAQLDVDSINNDIKFQEISLKKAQINLDEIKSNPNPNQYDLKRRELDLESAILTLENSKSKLEKATIIAPISGQIAYINNKNIGDNVNANETFIVIADPSNICIQYTGDNSTQFGLGQEVDIKYRNNKYKGKVVMSQDNVPQDLNAQLKNTIRIKPEGISDYSIGDTAEITLVLENKENVIVVPKNVVSNYGGKFYIQVLENNMKFEREVEVGIQTADSVEILSGIKEGDKIIIR